jgi:hypothetical protein
MGALYGLWMKIPNMLFVVSRFFSVPFIFCLHSARQSGTWFTHPTSARWGSGHPGFPATSLFVSQGADVFEWQASDGVFRVDF